MQIKTRLITGLAWFVSCVLSAAPFVPQSAVGLTSSYSKLWDSSDAEPACIAFQAWCARWIQYPASHGPEFLRDGVKMARSRRIALLAAIKTDPERAIALAVPTEVRRQLPPEIVNELESRVSGVGNFTVEVVEGRNDSESLLRFISVNGQQYRAHVYGRRLVQQTKNGMPVHGIAVGTDLALHQHALDLLEADEQGTNASSTVRGRLGSDVHKYNTIGAFFDAEEIIENQESTIGPLTASTIAVGSTLSTAWTTGNKNVLIVRIDFSDMPGDPVGPYTNQPNVVTTAAYAQSVMADVADFYQKSSYGRTTLTSTVTSKLYRMPQTALFYGTSDNIYQLKGDVTAAIASDYSVVNYDRVIFAFGALPRTPSSVFEGAAGFAELGGPFIHIGGYFEKEVVAHELGHTYGLLHANVWLVADGNPASPTGTSQEYSDNYDTMGGGVVSSTGIDTGDFSSWAKSYLGWLTDDRVQTVTSNGTYRIGAFDEPAGTGIAALKVIKDGTRNYWVSIRRQSKAVGTNIGTGAYIIWGYNSLHTTNLLDMNTPGVDRSDAALNIGGSFSDPDANVTIRPLANGGSSPTEYMDVQITFGPSIPAFSSQPSDRSVIFGGRARFNATATGVPAPTYQWQRRPFGATAWSNVLDDSRYSGARTGSLIVASVSPEMDGDSFQCVASSSAGNASSTPVGLKIISSGVSTVAGEPGKSTEVDGQDSDAGFNVPHSIAIDSTGNVFVTDSVGATIRKVTTNGTVTTFAGHPDHGGWVDGASGAAFFHNPFGIVADSSGNLFVADYANFVVRKVTPLGIVSTFAGAGLVAGEVDGTGTAARFNFPVGIALDRSGTLYVSDERGYTIRKISTAGVVTTLAGQAGIAGSQDGLGLAAQFNRPSGIAVDKDGNVFVADSLNYTIRRIGADGTVSTFAGHAGSAGSVDGSRLSARFTSPKGLAFDGTNNLYVTDGGTLRKIDATGLVTTFAGQSNRNGYTDGPLTQALFTGPTGIAFDRLGNLWVADGGGEIRLVFATLNIVTQPTNQTVNPGQSVQLAVGATGPQSLSYQWNKNGVPIAGATRSTLTLATAQTADVGSYTVTVTSGINSVTSSAAILTVTVPNTAPAIVGAPNSQSATVGDTVVFNVGVTGQPAPTFQWLKNGAALSDGGSVSGSTTATLILTTVKSVDAASYRVVVTNSLGTVTSDAATLTVNPVGFLARLSNLSVRTKMSSGQTLIIGLVVQGGQRNLLIRAAGPALINFGLTTPIADPRLDLYDANSNLLFSNDDWPSSLSPVFDSVGAFSFAPGSKDAAFVQSLNGLYSVFARGTGTGVILVEAYDTGTSNSPRLINLSARNFVGTGDDILIAGFALGGSGTKKLLIRGVGPTLIGFGVSGVLVDPKIELYDAKGIKLAENDNWDASLAAAFSSAGAFPLISGSKDSALVVTLPSSTTYTVQVKGADGGTGEALVEIYEVP